MSADKDKGKTLAEIVVPSNRGATTAEVLMLYEYETNPVTRCSYRQIIGNRIDKSS